MKNPAVPFHKKPFQIGHQSFGITLTGDFDADFGSAVVF